MISYSGPPPLVFLKAGTLLINIADKTETGFIENNQGDVKIGVV